MANKDVQIMKFDFWIVLSVKESRHVGGRFECQGTPKAFIKKPSLGPLQIRFKAQLNVPITLFVQPEISLKLDVPEPKDKFSLSPEVMDGIADAIRGETGLNATISMPADQD